MSAIIQSNRDFEIFFRENFSSVYAFMKRYTGDDELAADLAQETFIRVYERRDEIVSVDYFAQLDESNVDDYDFLQEVTRQETMRMLYVAINQLPPQTRNVILLNLEGKTNPEVAEELGISVNTVKCLKKSAYEILRGALSKNYFVILMFLLGE